jgi:hypothetical protein
MLFNPEEAFPKAARRKKSSIGRKANKKLSMEWIAHSP